MNCYRHRKPLPCVDCVLLVAGWLKEDEGPPPCVRCGGDLAPGEERCCAACVAAYFGEPTEGQPEKSGCSECLHEVCRCEADDRAEWEARRR